GWFGAAAELAVDRVVEFLGVRETVADRRVSPGSRETAMVEANSQPLKRAPFLMPSFAGQPRAPVIATPAETASVAANPEAPLVRSMPIRLATRPFVDLLPARSPWSSLQLAIDKALGELTPQRKAGLIGVFAAQPRVPDNAGADVADRAGSGAMTHVNKFLPVAMADPSVADAVPSRLPDSLVALSVDKEFAAAPDETTAVSTGGPDRGPAPSVMEAMAIPGRAPDAAGAESGFGLITDRETQAAVFAASGGGRPVQIRDVMARTRPGRQLEQQVSLPRQEPFGTGTRLQFGSFPRAMDRIAMLPRVPGSSKSRGAGRAPSDFTGVDFSAARRLLLEFPAGAAADRSAGAVARAEPVLVALVSPDVVTGAGRNVFAETVTLPPFPSGYAPPAVLASLLQVPAGQTDTLFVPEPTAPVGKAAVPAATPADTGTGALDKSAYRIFVFAAPGLDQGRVDAATTSLRASGYTIRQPKRVGFRIGRNHVRYYYARDAEIARTLSAAIGGVARDFTSFSPSPPKGTVEVWLAGEVPSSRIARGSKPRVSPRPPKQDPRVQALRDSLVKRLRSGDLF
ncbi:MAG: hypothetical protein ACE5FS_07320, partial [Paracoccaceae bacterium]